MTTTSYGWYRCPSCRRRIEADGSGQTDGCQVCFPPPEPAPAPSRSRARPASSNPEPGPEGGVSADSASESTMEASTEATDA